MRNLVLVRRQYTIDRQYQALDKPNGGDVFTIDERQTAEVENVGAWTLYQSM